MSPELNHLPIGVFFMNSKAQLTYANIKYREILATPQTAQNPQWINMIDQEDRGKVLKEWQHCATSAKPAHFTCRLIKSNGNVIWTDIRLAPSYDDLNEFTGFSGTLADITNQVMLEKVVERFKKAVEYTESQIIFTDASGIITFANTAVQNTTGFAPEEVIGTKAGRLWGGLMDSQFYTDLWDTIAVKKLAFEGELINKKKSGETYYAHVSITPILDEFGEVEFFVGIERDITYIKEMDKVKTEFISLASHQLRTPLSSIKWLCELFWQFGAGELTKDQTDIVQKIQTENERLIRLVNSLLTVSRVDAKKIGYTPSLEDIASLLTKAVEDLKPKLTQKSQTVEVIFDSNLPKTMLDPKLVTEALANLLSNAHKYTPDNGRLGVKAKLDTTQMTKELVVTVTDSGIGIPAEDKHRIFEKFFRAKNAKLNQTDGNGLGLYFVKWVMDQHGGRVWFDSKENTGSTFYLAFPLTTKS